MKTVEQQRARDLRGQGRSVKEIARELQVSPSSVSRWIREVPLTEEQRRRLLMRISQGRLDGAVKLIRAAKHQRAEDQHRGRMRAREADASYAAGCMLFRAEGDKRRNAVALANLRP
jgi:predicted transcriptional regulator